MQPISLHRLVKTAGIEKPHLSLIARWKLCRSGNSAARIYSKRLAQTFAICQSCLIGLVILDSALFDAPIDLVAATFGFAWFLAFFVPLGVAVGAAGGVAVGVAAGAAGSVMLGVGFGVAPGVASGVGLGVASGVGLGVASSVALGVALGGTFDVAFGSALGVALGVAFGVEGGVATGVAAGVAFVATALRIPYWPIEHALWLVSGRKLTRAPPLSHELSCLPFPGLRRAMLDSATTHPEEVRRALDASRVVPGQIGTVAHIETALALRDLRELAEAGDWDAIAEWRGSWLPDSADAPETMLVFRDVGREVRSAIQPETSPERRVETLQNAIQRLERMQFRTAEKVRGRLERLRARELEAQGPSCVQAWIGILTPLLDRARRQASQRIPNVFTSTGLPLDAQKGEGSDRQVFRGREAAIQEVADALKNPGTSIAVTGPRRVGKTSLLKMFTVFRPNDLFVLLDGQGAEGESPAAFVRKVPERFLEAARRERWPSRPEPPASSSEDPMEIFADWLDRLEAAARGDARRVVFCIDEYEQLDRWRWKHPEALSRLLGLVRSAVQHKSHVRFLIAGASPLASMDPVWADHFVSTQGIVLDFLGHDSAVDLLRAPFPGFPKTAMPEDVAERIWELTRGQPHLVQCMGYEVVERLNREGRRQATLADVDEAAKTVTRKSEGYLSEYATAPESARKNLEALARGEAPSWAPGDRQWLRNRGYLTAEDRIRVPLFRDWLVAHLRDRE